MLRAFGARAERWAASTPTDLPILAVDESGVEAAYLHAVAARERAEPFLVWPCLPSERAMIARAFAPRAHDGRSFDDRRTVYTHLADGTLVVDGTKVADLRATGIVAALPAIADIVRLADGLFAASPTELERRRALFPAKPFTAVGAWPATSVPHVRATAAEFVVVWAPERPLGDLLVVLNALEELRTPVVVVAEHRVYQSPGRSAAVRDPADALGRAAIVIDADDETPSNALALAQVGRPLAVASTSGAADHLDGACVYDPWDWRSVFDAAMRALGSPAVRSQDLVAIERRIRSTVDAATASPPTDGPLVSVVIPTYNRPDRVRSALAALSLQHYRNLEIIVVNDGGDPVGEIVAEFPNARYLSYDENRGPEHALNVGFAAAHGTYVTLLPDDDAFYPDHLARMVDVLERSGAAVAHGNTLIRFLDERADPEQPAGFAADVFATSLEKTEALYNSSIAGHAFVFRRDVAERLGWFDETLPVLGDQEFQTRLSLDADFAHVDRFTVEWRLTGGEANISTRKRALVPAALRQWFTKHATDRPAVEAQRAACIALQERGSPGFAPVLRLERRATA